MTAAIVALCIVVALVVLVAGGLAAFTAMAALKDIRIVLHTDHGDVDATLYASKVPVTVANFLNLAQQHF